MLCYDDWVSQAFGIIDFNNRTGPEQKFDFFADCLRSLWTQFSVLLLYGLESRVDVKLVRHYRGVYSLHVVGFPGEG